MPKARLAVVSFGFVLLLSAPCASLAEKAAAVPDAPVPAQILSAKKVFIANSGCMLDLNMVSGDQKRCYNQFYADIQAWGHYQTVVSPADADLVLQFGITYIPRQFGADVIPFPSFRLTLLDPKTNMTLWVMDEFLVDKPGLSVIREKNRDKAFNEAINRIVGDLKALAAQPATASK